MKKAQARVRKVNILQRGKAGKVFFKSMRGIRQEWQYLVLKMVEEVAVSEGGNNSKGN